MKVLAIVPNYVPYYCSGAETMLHSILSFFKDKGHECRVICDRHNLKEYEGVNIFVYKESNLATHADWADVIITQLGTVVRAESISKRFGKPVYNLIHNTNPHNIYDRSKVKPIYNAEWVKQVLMKQNFGDGIVCRPLVKINDYQVDRSNAEYITVIGLHINKGGGFIQQLASLMPGKKFLAVCNYYGSQIKDKMPVNVTVQRENPDIKSVYTKTRIMLCPSVHESWCRVASEAMCSGIPIIYNPNNGLSENICEYGIDVPRGNLSGWIKAIKKIEENYNHYSNLSLQRAIQQDGWNDFENLEKEFIYASNSVEAVC